MPADTASPAEPAPDTLTIERRRAMRLMAAAVGWFLIALGPALLVLIFVIDGMHLDGLGLIRMGSALVLSAIGVWLIFANRRDWLVLVLDARGLVLRRGRREFACRWDEMRSIEVTSRRNGKTSIPTVRVGCEGGRDIWLDDVFTMRQRDLGDLLKARVTAAGNAFAAQPVHRADSVRRKRGRWAWLVLIALFLGLALAALAQVVLHAGK